VLSLLLDFMFALMSAKCHQVGTYKASSGEGRGRYRYVLELIVYELSDRHVYGDGTAVKLLGE